MKNQLTIVFIILLLIVPGYLYASPLEEINSWVDRQLSSDSSTLASYFFLLFGGVLASLLPCTYPLYPITVNILKARSQLTKKWLHPVFYFAGIAIMYFLFGIIAAITGGAFNTVLHLPLTNLIIAIVIFLLGLSTLDLLYLPIFSGSSANNNNKSVAGTFLMGMGAGLLSSACVGPVVVSILIGIASSGSVFSLAVSLTAASKMLLFGAGVGLPFLLIGVFGMSLPKSGKWMKYVQLALGGLIIWFSFIYLDKALSGYGFTESAAQLIGLGALLVLIAVFYTQPETLLTYQKTKKSLFVLLGIIGSLMLFKAFAPEMTSGSLASNSGISENAISSSTTEQHGDLVWFLDKKAAYAVAKEKSKPVFIDFHADWCTNCKEFQKTTQTNPALNEALKNAILLKVYEGTPTFAKYAGDSRYPELKVGLPFFLITDKDENLLYKTNDYLKSDEMGMFLSN